MHMKPLKISDTRKKPYFIFLSVLFCAFCVFCVFRGLYLTKGETPRTFRIVAFGDSTTAFREGIKKVYSQRLREALSNQEPGYRFEVFNAGVRGHTTRQGKDRFERDVLGRKPDLAIIQFGLNDSCIDVHKSKTDPRVAQTAYEENLIYFISRLREQGGGVILMTPNPGRWSEAVKKTWGKPPYNTSDPMGFNLLNHKYAESVRRVARKTKVPLIDVYRLFMDYDKKEGRSMDDLLPDGLHPNDTGHRMITNALLPVVRAKLAGIVSDV